MPPVGESGRSFALRPDQGALAVLLGVVESAEEAQGGFLNSLRVPSGDAPSAKYTVDGKRTNANFTPKLPFTGFRGPARSQG